MSYIEKKKTKQIQDYAEMIAKASTKLDNFEDFANHLHLGLGDIREIQFNNKFLEPDWDNLDRVPELLVELLNDDAYLHFVVKYFLNIDLLPFQLVILKTLWNKPLPMLIATRGGGKTFIMAIYAIVRMLLHQGCKVAVIGASLRQSMIIFNYITQIYEASPILQDICNYKPPKRDIAAANATWELGKSKAVFLPLGNGEKIRGQRANIILCDEFGSINKAVFETVVRGFAAVKSEGTYYNVMQSAKNKALQRLNYTPNKTQKIQQVIKIPNVLHSNQIVLAGTAGYQFNHFYQYYRYYKAIVTTAGDKTILKREFPDLFIPDEINPEDYAILRIPYDVIPEGMMDATILSQGRATMDPAVFDMEYGCIFRADSDGFYLASIIKNCTCPLKNVDGSEILFSARLVGDSTKKYVMGIDPASENDNFTINIIEINPFYRAVVYQFAINRKGYEELKRVGYIQDHINDYNTFCVTHIRDLCRRFNVELICMDAGGGGISMRELLKDSTKLLDDSDQLILDMDDEYARSLKGRPILKMIEFSSSDWRVEAHHGLKKDLVAKNLLFPYYDASLIEQYNQENTRAGKGFDRLDDCFVEIEQCKQETTLIRHSQTPTGREAWDVPRVIGIDAEEIRQTLKKDRFTSLLLSNWAARLYEEELRYAGITFYGGIAQKMVKEDVVGTPFTGKGAAKMRYLDDNFINGISSESNTNTGRKIFY